MADVGWTYEAQAARSGYQLVAGVDEAGRGPLAGPVLAAAVILPFGQAIDGVDDSKRLSPKKRAKAFDLITKAAVAVALGVAGPAEIDRLNIHQASLLAMRRAVTALDPGPDFLLVDGPYRLDLILDQEPIVGGDGLSVSIAAASIVAKVARDNMMAVIDTAYPGYGLAKHKGYATADHIKALAAVGPSPAHRRSFRPVLEGLG